MEFIMVVLELFQEASLTLMIILVQIREMKQLEFIPQIYLEGEKKLGQVQLLAYFQLDFEEIEKQVE